MSAYINFILLVAFTSTVVATIARWNILDSIPLFI